MKDRVRLPRQQKNEVLKAVVQLGGKRWQQLRSVRGGCSVCDGGVCRQEILSAGAPDNQVRRWSTDDLRICCRVINTRDVISYHSFPSSMADTRVQHSEVMMRDEEHLGCGGLHRVRRTITVLLQTSTGIGLKRSRRQIF